MRLPSLPTVAYILCLLANDISLSSFFLPSDVEKLKLYSKKKWTLTQMTRTLIEGEL